jgi:hypothetical protein
MATLHGWALGAPALTWDKGQQAHNGEAHLLQQKHHEPLKAAASCNVMSDFPGRPNVYAWRGVHTPLLVRWMLQCC